MKPFTKSIDVEIFGEDKIQFFCFHNFFFPMQKKLLPYFIARCLPVGHFECLSVVHLKREEQFCKIFNIHWKDFYIFCNYSKFMVNLSRPNQNTDRFPNVISKV